MVESNTQPRRIPIHVRSFLAPMHRRKVFGMDEVNLYTPEQRVSSSCCSHHPPMVTHHRLMTVQLPVGTARSSMLALRRHIEAAHAVEQVSLEQPLRHTLRFNHGELERGARQLGTEIGVHRPAHPLDDY